ncbi:MAG: hypothetical protein Ta2B_02890 [Termitinemataceae bacterium]|nr:MAG: hypothetical protein Ta2B_02890 [Termitinemataceae bacterium]
MNLATVIIGAIVLAFIAFLLIRLIRNFGKGKGACNCGCDDCVVKEGCKK